MALDAELMLVDEPTSASIPNGSARSSGCSRRVAAHRQTMLIVTHEMQFAREIADRVLFMDGGRIVEQGPPEAIFEAPRDARLSRPSCAAWSSERRVADARRRTNCGVARAIRGRAMRAGNQVREAAR